MIIKSNCKIGERRTLRKVRTQFLHKRKETEEQIDVNPDTKYLGGNTMCVLHADMGLIESNRKISLGPQNLNLLFKFSDFLIESRPYNRFVQVNLANGKGDTALPWDYMLKRLESYGDLELATLAHRLDKFHNASARVVSEFLGCLGKDDPVTIKMLEEAKARATKVCEEAEKNRIFFKLVFEITKDRQQSLSNSFSEGLLEEMGFSPESFIQWSETNGLPIMFGTDSDVYSNAARSFFDLAIFSENNVYVSPIMETFVYDNKKGKKKIAVETIGTLEPISNGFLVHYYFVGKDINSGSLEAKTKCPISGDTEFNADFNSLPKNFDSYENEFKQRKSEERAANFDIV